jgi:hypothetical protein
MPGMQTREEPSLLHAHAAKHARTAKTVTLAVRPGTCAEPPRRSRHHGRLPMARGISAEEASASPLAGADLSTCRCSGARVRHFPPDGAKPTLRGCLSPVDCDVPLDIWVSAAAMPSARGFSAQGPPFPDASAQRQSARADRAAAAGSPSTLAQLPTRVASPRNAHRAARAATARAIVEVVVRHDGGTLAFRFTGQATCVRT